MDRGNKGRTCSGENHYCAKLSKDDVTEILKSTERQRILAERYGVARSTIAMIQTKKKVGKVVDIFIETVIVIA